MKSNRRLKALELLRIVVLMPKVITNALSNYKAKCNEIPDVHVRWFSMSKKRLANCNRLALLTIKRTTIAIVAHNEMK